MRPSAIWRLSRARASRTSLARSSARILCGSSVIVAVAVCVILVPLPEVGARGGGHCLAVHLRRNAGNVAPDGSGLFSCSPTGYLPVAPLCDPPRSPPSVLSTASRPTTFQREGRYATRPFTAMSQAIKDVLRA